MPCLFGVRVSVTETFQIHTAKAKSSLTILGMTDAANTHLPKVFGERGGLLDEPLLLLTLLLPVELQSCPETGQAPRVAHQQAALLVLKTHLVTISIRLLSQKHSLSEKSYKDSLQLIFNG